MMKISGMTRCNIPVIFQNFLLLKSHLQQAQEIIHIYVTGKI